MFFKSLNLQQSLIFLLLFIFSLQFICWRNQVVCPVVFPTVWILLIAFLWCGLTCSSVLYSFCKLVVGSRDLIWSQFEHLRIARFYRQDFLGFKCWAKPLQILSYLILKIIPWGLPWWRSGWESACQCRGHGFEPWSGKIPHAAEQLGPWATVTEPAHLEPVLRNKRGHDGERPAHRDEGWPPLATVRESPRTETKTQHSHK